MAIDDKHPEYSERAPEWQAMRDVLAGQRAVHKAGVTYLPKLIDQTPQEYEAYKLRAGFFNATGRTLEALHGLMFRKPVAVTMPAAFEEIAADVTMAGHSLTQLIQMVGREILSVGRVGVMVDFPPVVQQPSNAAQAAQSGLRPFATLYRAESILHWRTQRIANRVRLVRVVLSETFEPSPEWSGNVQIRVLELDEGGQYVQEVYRKPKDRDWEKFGDTIVPLRRGARMAEIPFWIIGPEAISADCQQAPLLDMAEVNLSHYRSTADLEHGAHLTAMPMLFMSGVELGEGERVTAGSQTAITSGNADADGKWIEFTGQGLGALEKRCEAKEKLMAALGASILAPEKKQAEAMVTVQLRTSHETSMLATIAGVLSASATQIMTTLADWAGITGDTSAQVNSDFTVARVGAQELTALVAAWQQGAISWPTLFFNLRGGELVADDVTEEDERARIADNPPGLTMPQAGAGGGGI